MFSPWYLLETGTATQADPVREGRSSPSYNGGLARGVALAAMRLAGLAGYGQLRQHPPLQMTWRLMPPRC